MARRLLPVLMMVSSIVVASCYAPAGAYDLPASAESEIAQEGKPEGEPQLPQRPVDPALAPVSRSHLSDEAKRVFDVCVRDKDVPHVVGMALVPAARDVGKYMMVGGKDPELQDGTAVWLVQLQGEIQYRWGTVFHPVCMVKNGEMSIFAPYGGWNHDGSIWLPPDDYIPPTLALPPLAP